MPSGANLEALNLGIVVQRCAQESEHFFQRMPFDPSFCYELFRRAILERNQKAWEHCYSQYRPLVAGWVARHSSFARSGEEAQYFVNRAFEKMWTAITPERFGMFHDLKSLLRYLQMCVHSAILDFVRKAEFNNLEQLMDYGALDLKADNPTIETMVLDRVQREEFWRWMEARLKNEKERKVVHDSYILALKPRQIYQQHKKLFKDVQEIYRIKENVLARLRRDPYIIDILS